jgi:hypothetical protein
VGLEPGEIEEIVVLAKRRVLGIIGLRRVGRAFFSGAKDGDPILNSRDHGLAAGHQSIHGNRTRRRPGLPFEPTESEAQA